MNIMAVRRDRRVAYVNKLKRAECARNAKRAVVHPGIFLKRPKSIRKCVDI
jgi:hypothetical protein